MLAQRAAEIIPIFVLIPVCGTKKFLIYSNFIWRFKFTLIYKNCFQQTRATAFSRAANRERMDYGVVQHGMKQKRYKIH